MVARNITFASKMHGSPEPHRGIRGASRCSRRSSCSPVPSASTWSPAVSAKSPMLRAVRFIEYPKAMVHHAPSWAGQSSGVDGLRSRGSA